MHFYVLGNFIERRDKNNRRYILNCTFKTDPSNIKIGSLK